MRKISEIIVHCAATPEGKAFTVADIDAWHKKRGFRCIGYHLVIYLDGSVHEGCAIEEVGAHCLGHNANSIGICYIGGCAATVPTAHPARKGAEKGSLVGLGARRRRRFQNASVHGHDEFANKACPSFNVKTSGLCEL